MKRLECLEFLSQKVSDHLVVIGMTGANWEWNQLSDHPGNMKIGSMGNAAALGLGMALGLAHRRVLVFESDGSTMLDMPTLTTIGTYRPTNLSVFVFDNERYSGSRISEPSATAFNASLEDIAKGAGIISAQTVRTIEEFEQAANQALDGEGPAYIVCKVEEDVAARHIPKPTMDYLEHKYRLARYLEETEGISMFQQLR